MEIKNNMKIEFTPAERALFAAQVSFLMAHENLSLAEAQERGMNKVLQKRSMAKKLKFKH